MKTKLYHWLFSEEERKPVGFINVLFLCIIISVAVNLMLIPIITALFKVG